jgi:hypothetical protein
MHKLVLATLAFALVAPSGAFADTAADVAALRQEMAAMRAAYETRLQSLEQRLQRAEAAMPAAAPATPSASIAAQPVAAAAPPAPAPNGVAADATAAATPAGANDVASAGGGANGFNPSMSLILSGLYTRTSKDPATYAIAGFPLPPGLGIGPGTRGFSLAESELGFAANVDPYLRGAANIALESDNTLSIEEAYIQTTSLGGGLSLKAGRFFSGIGYLNPQHSHTWDFVDNPLAYQALLGTQYDDDGVQLLWVPPIDRFLELGAELGRGRSYPGTDSSRNGAGMASLFAHTGGDIGDSQSWRAGLSMLNAKATDQDLLATDASGSLVTNAFNGSTRVYIADAIWKWAPHGNATRTNLKLQGEYLRGTRSGSLAYDVGGADSLGNYRAVQSGWYLQGVYQFMPYWRVGLRTERLDSGSPDYGINNAVLATGGFRPHKNSLMVDFNPSEFSRVRLQFAQDHSREGGGVDNQVFLQYQMSLGAHGAHSY